jgi:hypothetical protein
VERAVAAEEAGVRDDAAPSSACGHGADEADGRTDSLEDQTQPPRVSSTSMTASIAPRLRCDAFMQNPSMVTCVRIDPVRSFEYKITNVRIGLGLFGLSLMRGGDMD